MTLVLPAVALVLLALPAGLARLRDRLPVAHLGAVNTVSVAFGTLVLWIGLLMLGFPTLVGALADIAALPTCPHVIAALYPGGSSVLSWIATLAWIALTSSLVVASVRTCRRARIATIEPALGDHTPCDGFDLVALPTDEVVAYSVGGAHPQVVVSRGIVALLDDEELAAVVRHERAHTTLAHGHVLVLAAALERILRWVPPVRAGVQALRDSLERWADDVAVAGRPAHRDAVEHALLRIGAVHAHDDIAVTRHIRERSLLLRRRPGRAPRSLLVGSSLPVAFLALFPAWASLDWLSVSHHAIAFGGYCPH